jgi:hypothetical protein
MTTMTEREVQKRLVDLSVITLSALVFGGGYLLASSVDRERARLAPPMQEETVQLATVSLDVADVAPVPGLQPAPPPTRRVVVVRRTRAS